MRLDKLVRLDKLEGGVDNAIYWTGMQELDRRVGSGQGGSGMMGGRELGGEKGERAGRVQGCDLQ